MEFRLLLFRSANLRIAVAETTRRHAEVLKAMAMGPQLQRQWTERSRACLTAKQDMTDTASTLSSASKVLRMLLQSLVLTAGALLVIEGKATGGVIFASSLLRSEDRRVGKECVRTFRSRWSRYH